MKKTHYKIFAFLLFLGTWISTPSFATVPANFSLAPMLQKVLPAVVNIRAQIKNPFIAPPPEGQPQNKLLSVASGVIVDAKNGYILTNSHVIEGAQTVTVTLSDSRHYSAKIIGTDKPSDIALLQIKAKNLSAITISNSNDLKVGDLVAAVGNPFGLNQSVTSGIVSALGRTTLGIENYENFIQTDAPINPGNSGGALINAAGELVGINTAILAPEHGSIGIGFAIPSNMAKSVMQQLIQYGNVRRGMLGIGAQDITPELADAFDIKDPDDFKGAAVTEVMPNTPAEKAGLQVGDIITSINNAVIKNANDVVNSIAFLRVDSKATIAVLRNNKPLSLNAVITDPQKGKQSDEEKDPFLHGVSLKNFSLDSAIHGEIKGVLIVTVEEDSNAWHSDLRPGDIVISANQQKVTAVAELKKIAAATKHDLLLNVLRGPGAVFLIISKEP